jgi:transposase
VAPHLGSRRKATARARTAQAQRKDAAQRRDLGSLFGCGVARPAEALRTLADLLLKSFRSWQRDRTLDKLLERLRASLAKKGLIDNSTWVVDATNIRASRAAAGAKRGIERALGRSRGGLSTKLHLVCDGSGIPLAAHASAGQRHEASQFEDLLSAVRLKTTLAQGRPRTRPELLLADRGYDSGRIRRYLGRRGIRCMIPERRPKPGTRRRRKGRPPRFDEALYKRRNVVERLVGWLKEHRRIATRFEKNAEGFLAMVKLAFLRRYLRVLFSDRT